MTDIVLDTNCLLACLPRRSPFRHIWEAFLDGRYNLCFTTDILDEYEEIIAQKTNPEIAGNVIRLILEKSNTKKIDVFFKFELITVDPDDNKFVDCAVAAGANFIVSNDRHFDVLKANQFPYVNVIKLDDYSEMIKDNAESI